MASSYTGLGTELMTTGENAGNWGTKTNVNLQIIEQISGGYTAQSIAGSAQTTTLSVSDGSTGATLAHRIIEFTGTITGNQIVTIPLDVQQMYIIKNNTSGAYTVQFKYVSGSGSSVTWGTSDKGTKLIYAAADHATNPNLVDSNIGGVGAVDLNGATLTLDADGDTDITADTDDQIDIRIAGADDFQFTANTFTAQSGSTIAAQALTATTITASGIVKTDDTTEATSTTDGSLQTDGGLSVAKDAVIGDDLKLLSDSAVLNFGADSDTTLTHTDGTGLTLNSTNKLCFYDTALYIHSSTDGQLDLVADTEIQIAATTIDINGAVALNGAITGATNITLSGELDAATLDISGNADIDGTTNLDAVDIDGAVQLDATFTVGADDQGYDVKLFGDTASAYMLWDTSADDLILGGAAGLIVPDGQFTLGSTAVTTTAAEINLIDGGTSRGTTAVADGDGLLVNDGGTMRMTNVTTLKTYFQTGISSAADDISAGDAAVNITTTSGNITIDAQDGDTDIIFKGTDSSTDTTALTLDMSDAGTAIFNNDVVLDSDSCVLKFGDDQDVTLTHTDGTGLTLNSTSKLTFGDAATYINQSSDGVMTVAGEATIDLTASTAVLVSNDLKLDSDSSVLSFGADDDTTLTHTDGTGLTLNSTNKLCFQDTGTYVGSNADGDLDVVSDGTAIDSINLESAGGITLDAGSTTHGITYEDDGTAMLQITNSSSDVIIKPLVDAKDIIFQQYDGTAVLTIEDNATANIPAGKLALGGTAVTSTASELNLLDGGTSVGSSITIADADGFVVNDGGTMKTIPASDIKTYNPGGTSWQAVITGNTTAVAGRGYFCNTTSAAFTLTLPSSPSIGDEVSFIDYAGTFDSNNLTIARNSEKIHGASEDLTVATERAANTLVYTDGTQGWLLKSK